MMDTQHQSSLFCWGEQLSVPNFEKGGSEKTTVWGNLKTSRPNNSWCPKR